MPFLARVPAPLMTPAMLAGMDRFWRMRSLQDVQALSPAQREPEPALPADLRAALAQAPGANAQWQAITIAARRDFIQWLDTARQAETRVRRIRTACDMLAQGKRRICCFDRSGLHGKGPRAPAAAG